MATVTLKNNEAQSVPLNLQRLPRHIAIVMDGNGRWANERHLPRVSGHKAGLESLRTIISECVKLNIEVLTIFAFSSENWQRPPEEVSFLMDLFYTALQREVQKLNKRNVKVNIVGDKSGFSKKLQDKIAWAEELTQRNTGLQFNIAANFGGQWDIIRAVKNIARAIEEGSLTSQNITAEMFAAQLSLGHLPPPDLLIRTSGEQRISNFLLWELAYTELYFCQKNWPDFDAQALHDALKTYANRERRFGQTSTQLMVEGHLACSSIE